MGRFVNLGFFIVCIFLVSVPVFAGNVPIESVAEMPVQTNPYSLPYPGDGITPYAEAPLCPNHNSTRWHPLWDSERGCHFDHEHKHNPGLIYKGMPRIEFAEAQAMLALFGPPGAWFGGTSISYPWQTFKGAGANYPKMPADYALRENSAKHGGYGWLVRYNIPHKGRSEWIKDFRLQYHAIPSSLGAVTQYHSFSLEAFVCRQNQGCRLIRTGGWVDFGNLIVNGKNIPIGSQVGNTDRRRLHYSVPDTKRFSGNQYKLPFFWYGTVADSEANRPWDTARPFDHLIIGLAGKDVWSNVHPDNPFWDDLFCPDFQCNKNGSTIQAHLLSIDTLQTEFDGWTDRYGSTSDNCTAPGLDCIPTLIEPGKLIYLQYRDDQQLGYNAEGQRDFDSSPEGVYWIKYPN